MKVNWRLSPMAEMSRMAYLEGVEVVAGRTSLHLRQHLLTPRRDRFDRLYHRLDDTWVLKQKRVTSTGRVHCVTGTCSHIVSLVQAGHNVSLVQAGHTV